MIPQTPTKAADLFQSFIIQETGGIFREVQLPFLDLFAELPIIELTMLDICTFERLRYSGYGHQGGQKEAKWARPGARLRTW